MARFKYTEQEATWAQVGGSQIFLGDVVDESTSASMGVGYGRYTKGESNEWTVTYDEVLVVHKGRFTVGFEGGAVTAGPGEIIWIESGTSVVYTAEEDAQLIYVTYPVWGATEAVEADSGKLRDVDAGTVRAARESRPKA